jgi:FkbM family methyltransferase
MKLSSIFDLTIAGKLPRFPFKLIPSNAEMPILQGRLSGKKWIVGSGNHGCWLGTYECEVRRVFEQSLKRGGVVFDVGAHVGFYTLLSSLLVGSEGRVYSFEPNRRNIWYLKEHLRINRITNVRVMEVAVSDRSGEGFFEEGTNAYTGHLGADGQVTVRTVCMDDLVRSCEVPPPQLIKIDVEGAEMLVLEGAREVLRDWRPVIILETHGQRMLEQSLQFLSLLPYDVHGVMTRPFRETNQFVAVPC